MAVSEARLRRLEKQPAYQKREHEKSLVFPGCKSRMAVCLLITTGVPMLSVQPKGKQKGCAGCNRKIKDRYLLKALDKYWHEDCLKCACCDCRLGEVGSTLYTKANLILCRRDYLRQEKTHNHPSPLTTNTKAPPFQELCDIKGSQGAYFFFKVLISCASFSWKHRENLNHTQYSCTRILSFCESYSFKACLLQRVMLSLEALSECTGRKKKQKHEGILETVCLIFSS